MKASENPLVSVIIPVHNGAKTMDRCLQGVTNSSYPFFECIVVDDCSSDNTVEIASSYGIEVIELSDRKNAAQARNYGAKAAKGDILLFLDSDVAIYPDSLSKAVKIFQENPEISALFGSYDDQPGDPGFFSQYKNLFHHYIHQTGNENAETFWTAFGAVKKDVFFKVRGFDDKMRMMEDIEFGYRLKDQGYEIRLVKGLRIKHLKFYSFSNMLKSDLFDRAVPWTYLMLKRKRLTGDLNLKPRHRFSAVVLLILGVVICLSIFELWILAAVPILCIIYMLLNRDFYKFFMKKRGFFFAMRIIPFHALYYLYSMLGVFVGFGKYYLTKQRDIT